MTDRCIDAVGRRDADHTAGPRAPAAIALDERHCLAPSSAG
jgi:hypothetical protein